MTSRLLLLTCLVGVAACDEFDAEEVRRQQRAWQSLHITDYAFVYEESCFCVSDETGGMRVEVRDGKVVSTVGAHSGAIYEEGTDRDLTIDDLFERVFDIGRDGADTFEAHYDPKYHFIKDLSIDQDDDTEDDGLGLEVSCFSEDPDACAVPTLTPDECAARGGEVLTIPKHFSEFVCGDERGGTPIGQVEPQVTICCTDFFW
jgi:hypothetical protein